VGGNEDLRYQCPYKEHGRCVQDLEINIRLEEKKKK
jgi:hypothetical protein